MKLNYQDLSAEAKVYLEELLKAGRSELYVESIIGRLRKWEEFISPRGRCVLDAIRADFYAYKAYLDVGDHRLNYIKSLMQSLRSFYDWLERTERIDASNMFKERVTYHAKPPNTSFMFPEEIFLIRRMIREWPLECAAWFEMALSTGMRPSEQSQIRACDIFFNETPADCELKTNFSPYVGAKIVIDTKFHKNKTNVSRIVWLGKLATKVLIRHMKKHGIGIGSVIPIFPWPREKCEAWIGVDLSNKMKKFPVFERFNTVNELNRPRSTDLLDVTKQEMSQVSEKFRELILSRQREAADKTEHQSIMSTTSGETQRKVTGRSPRRTFACMMWYRNVYGERRNMVRLMELMGHSGVGTGNGSSTMKYLLTLDLIKSDSIWARIMNGQAGDWARSV